MIFLVFLDHILSRFPILSPLSHVKFIIKKGGPAGLNKRKGKYVVALFSWCCFFDKLSLSLSLARASNLKKCNFFSLVVFFLSLSSLSSLSPLTQLNLSRLSLSLPLSRWFTMKKEYILEKGCALSLSKKRRGDNEEKNGAVFFFLFFLFFWKCCLALSFPVLFTGFPEKKKEGASGKEQREARRTRRGDEKGRGLEEKTGNSS